MPAQRTYQRPDGFRCSALTRGDGPRDWPAHPAIYEINAWVWLAELSARLGREAGFASVPGEEWDRIAALGFDAVWFMGVWRRSEAGRAISLANGPQQAEFRAALAGYRESDDVGSAYCIRAFEVDARLGGREGLASARRELSARGVRLLLDYVPNHLAPDHPWAGAHPDYFLRGSREDLSRDPGSFLESEGHVFACGRDPYFPPWRDVLQLNAFSQTLRAAATRTALDIADQCDGVRCDMAMLLLNRIFERTWGSRAGAKPRGEYWNELIDAVRERHPDFLFIAEAYWDLEWELQQLGFDYCYDKRLYDRLHFGDADSVRAHLRAGQDYQRRLVRFLENHDEPRAASAFPGDRGRACALAASTLPGARLFHEGQFEGRAVRVPVFLARRPFEAPDERTSAFYKSLMRVLAEPALREGHWELHEASGWPDNEAYRDLAAWSWRPESAAFSGADNGFAIRETPGDHPWYLVVVNLSAREVQARIPVPWGALRGRRWRMHDQFSNTVYERDGDELAGPGLYVGLGPWGFHCLSCTPEN